MKLFCEKTVSGLKPFEAIFDGDFNKYFEVVSREQLLDRELWRLLERQFELRWDSNDSGWRGEYWGKLMRGACLIYSHTKERKLYDVLTETANNLLGKADELGRIASYRIDSEYHGWDIWARKYVMLGLEYFYDICVDQSLKEKIVKALESQADYLVKTIGDEAGKTPVSKTSSNWGAINSVSVLQPMVKLTKLVKKDSYYKFIDMLITTQSMENFNVFDYAKNDAFFPYQYPITKAYETISCLEGLLDLANETDNQNYVLICQKFADKVLESDFTAIGGIGCYDETFNNSTKQQVVYSEIHKQETCVTVTFMKFLYSLYLVTEKKEYIDAIEKSFFNAYLGALNDKPYYGNLVRPLFYSYSPVFDNPRWDVIGGGRNVSSYSGFGCCIAIGSAGLGLIPKCNVLGNEDKIVLNLFMGGKYSLNGTEFTVKSNYPLDGNMEIYVEKYAGKGLELAVRYPYWAKGVKIEVNGKTVGYELQDGYIILSKKLNQSSKIGIEFDAPVIITNSEEVNGEVKGLYSISKCALVYAIDETNVPISSAYEIDESALSLSKIDDGNLTVKLKDGELTLEQYRNCGKNYFNKPNITAWIKKSL